MIATLERLEPNTPTMPVSHILANYFQKFVKHWTETDIQYLGELREETMDLPVEITVSWDGNASGTLVIRCYEDFTKWLKGNSGYKPLNVCTEKELMDETVSLYANYLIHNFWTPELLKIGPIQPRPSRPENWPCEPPTSTVGLLVEGHPLEIRLWVGTAA